MKQKQDICKMTDISEAIREVKATSEVKATMNHYKKYAVKRHPEQIKDIEYMLQHFGDKEDLIWWMIEHMEKDQIEYMLMNFGYK